MATHVEPRELTRTRAEALRRLVDAALERAAATLSEMSGEPIRLAASDVAMVPLVEVPSAAGSPDEEAVGVYVGMSGDVSGHLLMLLDAPVAILLAGLLLGEDPAALRLDEGLTASALAEAGNVACSSFMNVVGEATGLVAIPQPPAVLWDLRGAIVDVAAASLALAGDEALVIGTRLASCARAGQADQLELRLLAIPTPGALEAILARLEVGAR